VGTPRVILSPDETSGIKHPRRVERPEARAVLYPDPLAGRIDDDAQRRTTDESTPDAADRLPQFR
jgi:hypothetical protein